VKEDSLSKRDVEHATIHLKEAVSLAPKYAEAGTSHSENLVCSTVKRQPRDRKIVSTILLCQTNSGIQSLADKNQIMLNALVWYSRVVFTSAGLLTLIHSGHASVIFKADFEIGDLSEWNNTGTRGQNATPKNVQVVSDIVQQGNHAVKVTIHEDDVFNAQQLRAQLGGPKITVEEGSDTYMSFYMYMAEPPKDRDNFFYWREVRRRNTTMS
jgi:hypothetical protein